MNQDPIHSFLTLFEELKSVCRKKPSNISRLRKLDPEYSKLVARTLDEFNNVKNLLQTTPNKFILSRQKTRRLLQEYDQHYFSASQHSLFDLLAEFENQRPGVEAGPIESGDDAAIEENLAEEIWNEVELEFDYDGVGSDLEALMDFINQCYWNDHLPEDPSSLEIAARGLKAWRILFGKTLLLQPNWFWQRWQVAPHFHTTSEQENHREPLEKAHYRRLVEEASRSYTYGLHFSSIVMCRAIMEFLEKQIGRNSKAWKDLRTKHNLGIFIELRNDIVHKIGSQDAKMLEKDSLRFLKTMADLGEKAPK